MEETGQHSALGQRQDARMSSGDLEVNNEDQDDPPSLVSILEQPSEDQPQPQQQGVREEDLEQFRQKWRQEMSQGRTNSTQAVTAEQQKTATAAGDKAVELYLAGMELEQRGMMYEAMQKYRRAVQTDPSVENTVRQLLINRNQRQQNTTGWARDDNGNVTEPADPGVGDEEEEEDAQETEESVLRQLQQLTLSDVGICQPALPQTALHISCLPTEVLQLIVRWVVSSQVDVRSLDQMALVCRGFYALARDNQIWKRICYRVLGAGCTESGVPSVWRELYMSRPHVHFSGCYLSRASYIRCGETTGYQDASYRPWHMVQYYRLLRLLPDGACLMLTSADEPAQSVQTLAQPPARTGTAVPGHYRLRGDRVVAVLGRPRQIATRRTKARSRFRRDFIPYDPGEQILHIELEIRRWRLVWVSYEIVTRYQNGNEATHTIELGDQYPPLVFSRVRSYTACSEAPL